MKKFKSYWFWDSIIPDQKLLRIMKLTFFLIIAGLITHASNSYSQATKLSLKMDKATILEVFTEIENQSEFRIAYNSTKLNVDKRVDLDVKSQTVDKILDQILSEKELRYEIVDRYIVITDKETTGNFGIDGQQKAVSGKVTNKAGEPLPGVTIVVKGTTLGTVTNSEGEYTLTDVPDNAILQFSFVGMKTQEVEVGDQSTINVALAADAIGIEEVVAIGYGSRQKKDLTSAISTISDDKIGKIVTSNANMVLQGRAAGVYVGENSGNPAHAPKVRIRGVNTWGDSNPLYVIDGVPITDPRQSGYYAPLNIMNLIDPNDIESISVLKDASSAAIYGVRASNGVILITTKKGRQGEKVSAEFSSRIGVQNIVQELDLLNSQQYINHIQNVWASDPTASRNPSNVKYFDPASPDYLGGSPTYDWQSAVKNIDAPTQDYSLRISGGTEKSDYFLSLGSSSMEGTLIGSYFERLSANIKLNTYLNNWIKIGVDYRIASTDHRNPQSGENLWRYAQLIDAPPVQPIYGDGPAGYAPVVEGMQPDGTYSSESLYGAAPNRNMNGIVALNDSENELKRSIGILYAELNPIKDLTIKFQSTMDINNTKKSSFTDYASNIFYYDRGDPRSRGGGNSLGSYELGYNTRSTFINEVTIHYLKSFGAHNLDLLFSGMKQDYKSSGLDASTEYMSTTIPYLRRIFGENQYTRAISGFDRDALAGILGRISYNYQNRYYIDLTTRRDGSAHFAPDYRWGIFPSVSTAWRISEESFFQQMNWVNDLKIRAGWGQLGNQNTRSFAYLLPIITYPSYVWGDDPANPGMGYYSNGATVYSIPNKTLEWERTTTANVGFDAILFDNIDLTIEYYNKLTSGILQEVSLPNSTGIREQPVDNIASVRNSGIELSANYMGNIGKLNFSVGANFSTVKNVVEKTYNNIPLWNIEEGKSMFYLKGYKMGGIFQTEEEVDEWLEKYTDVNYQEAKISPGDVYFLDQRSAPDQPNKFYKDSLDNKIDSYDMVYLGKSIPGYYYGFDINLNYYGFDLNAQFTGVGDVDKINGIRAQFEHSSSAGPNLSTNILNAWSKENKSETMPRVIAGDPASNFRQSDMYLESGAYLRLSNIQLGYTLPTNVYNSLGNAISNLRIYVGSSNLFTITKYTGFDPENDDYPAPRVFFSGVNIRF